MFEAGGPVTPQAPINVGGNRVVLYSSIDHRHWPTGGCRQIVAGVLPGPAAGLAICQSEDEGGFYLFGCDAEWNSVTDTWHQTLADAMRQAEFEYAGVWRTWMNHDPAWVPMSNDEYQAAWDLFDGQFHFRPSVKRDQWPGIAEPTPSVTYDVAHVFTAETTARAIADLNVEMFTLFKACVPPGKRLYALDWQHPCYHFNPFGRFEFSQTYEGMVPVVPDGDYYIFLADDFSYGTFGHPWDATVQCGSVATNSPTGSRVVGHASRGACCQVLTRTRSST